MIRFFQRLLKPGGPAAEASEQRLTLAAFGKHPGWDDYLGKGVDTGLGVDTEALVHAKDALHSGGIRGQIDSGAWKNLTPEKHLEGFDHSFLWLRAGHVVLGRLWSSVDGKGRPYPMVLCVDGEGVTPGFALAKVLPELERLRAACVAASSAEQVTAECAKAQEALRTGVAEAALSLIPVSLSTEACRQFLEHPDLGPERIGLLRALHEIGAAGEHGTRRNAPGANVLSRHLRVPAAADSPRQSLLLWAWFLRCALPASVPLLLISRGGMGWIDAIIGEATSADLFCLQASTQALPLVSHVPYELTPELKPRLQEIETRFLRVESSPDGGLLTASGGNADRSPALPAAGSPVPAKGTKLPLVLMGVLVFIGLLVAGWALSRNRGSPPAASLRAAPTHSPATNVKTAVTQSGGKTNNGDSGREAARLKEEAGHRRLAEERRLATEKVEREQQEARLRAASGQTNKGVEAGNAKEPVAGKTGNEASQVVGKNRAEDEKAQARARENDADLAQISLAQGNYQRALELAQKWPGADRFQQLVTRVIAETNQLQKLGEFLNAGNYAPILTNRLPENDRFKELVSKAAGEKKLLDQATAEFAEGRYAFLQAQPLRDLKARPPFQKLLQDGSTEEGQLKKLKELQSAGKPQEARDLIARAGLSKPPFREIQQWAASELERTGREQRDELTVKSFFAQGDYAKALELCRKYPAHAAFGALATSINEEQKILAAAQQKFLEGNYSMVGELQGTASEAKPPFAGLVLKAREEQKTLGELEKLKQSNAWQAMPGELSKLPSEVVLKKPFENLRQWAKARALEDERLKMSDPGWLDAEFEVLLVKFNVLRPTDPRLRTPQARKENVIGAIGPRNKDYLRQVERLEEEYKKGGWLSQNDRQKLIAKLKETIRYWE